MHLREGRKESEHCQKPAHAGTLSNAKVTSEPWVTWVSHDPSRQGAQFAEVWVEGSRYRELSESQERLSQQREELERQRKSLSKRRPPVGGATAAGGRSSPAQLGKGGFAKPQVTWLVVSVSLTPSHPLPIPQVSHRRSTKRRKNCSN